MPATSQSATQPLFLSSIDCSVSDKSLLYDCSHDQLGLAACDEDFGLATVKCFGEYINFASIMDIIIIFQQMLMSVLRTLTTALRTALTRLVATSVSAIMDIIWTLTNIHAMVRIYNFYIKVHVILIFRY